MKMKYLSGLLKVVVVAVVLLLAVGWSVRKLGESRLAAAMVQFESGVGSLSLTDYVLPAIENNENAAVWLIAGAEAVDPSAFDVEAVSEVMDQEMGSWSPETLERARSLLASNDRTFDLLTRSLGLAESSFDFPYEEGFDAETPPLLEMYRAARLVALDARLALASDNLDRVYRDLEILDQMSTALGRESFVVSALIYLAVERLYLGSIRDLLATGPQSQARLMGLRRDLRGRGSADTVRRAIAGETAAVLDTVARRSSADSPAMPWSRGLLWVLEPFQLVGLLEFYGDVAQAIEVPWVETVEKNRQESDEGGWGRHPFVAPNILDAVDKLKAVELGQMLAVQAVDLSLQVAEGGGLPAYLEQDLSDPYASGSVLYELDPNGDARLVATEAVALWEALHKEGNERQKPIFLWRLSSS